MLTFPSDQYRHQQIKDSRPWLNAADMIAVESSSLGEESTMTLLLDAPVAGGSVLTVESSGKRIGI